MLVVQIAAGIVLAVVVLRFWRQALWLALVALLLSLAFVGWVWLSKADSGGPPTNPVLIAGGAIVFWGWIIRAAVRERRLRPVFLLPIAALALVVGAAWAIHSGNEQLLVIPLVVVAMPRIIGYAQQKATAATKPPTDQKRLPSRTD